jgi:zeaxanthin glucosyltransferase
MDEKKMKKTTILMVLYPIYSSFNSTFKLARALIEKGYNIIYCGSTGFEKYVLDNGFNYKVLEYNHKLNEELTKELKQQMEIHQKDNFLKKIRLRIRLNFENRMKVHEDLMSRFEEWLEQDPPGLALIDQLFIWRYSIPLLKLNIPLIGMNHALSYDFNAKIPPASSGIIPSGKPTIFSRMINILAWLKNRWLNYKFFIVSGITFFFGYGFSGRKVITDKKKVKQNGGKLRMSDSSLKLDIPEIFLFPREFDYPFAPQSTNSCYYGGYEIKRPEPQFNWDRLDEGLKLIYCSFGTESWAFNKKKRMDLFIAVMSAVERCPDYQLIVKMEEAEAVRFPRLPGNIFKARWVPQLDVLSKASLFITHGGASSIRESIMSGVPMIVFPFGRDQPGNASRVAYHQLGLKGDTRKTDSWKMGDLIDASINDATIQKSIKEMQKHFLNPQKDNLAIQFIEGFLSGKK